jgi:hypothetical protein
MPPTESEWFDERVEPKPVRSLYESTHHSLETAIVESGNIDSRKQSRKLVNNQQQNEFT